MGAVDEFVDSYCATIANRAVIVACVSFIVGIFVWPPYAKCLWRVRQQKAEDEVFVSQSICIDPLVSAKAPARFLECQERNYYLQETSGAKEYVVAANDCIHDFLSYAGEIRIIGDKNIVGALGWIWYLLQWAFILWVARKVYTTVIGFVRRQDAIRLPSKYNIEQKEQQLFAQGLVLGASAAANAASAAAVAHKQPTITESPYVYEDSSRVQFNNKRIEF